MLRSLDFNFVLDNEEMSREEREGTRKKTNRWPHADLRGHSASLKDTKEKDQSRAAVKKRWS